MGTSAHCALDVASNVRGYQTAVSPLGDNDDWNGLVPSMSAFKARRSAAYYYFLLLLLHAHAGLYVRG